MCSIEILLSYFNVSTLELWHKNIILYQDLGFYLDEIIIMV